MVACATVATSACVVEPPDVGRLDRVHVPPAEVVRIYSLSNGQTFGGLLNSVMSANEQASLLMAFREHASPRRMRQGTEISLRFFPARDEAEGSLRGVDVALTPDETVRLSRDPLGWRSELIETPVYIDTLYANGEIENVLWNAVVRNPILEGLTYEDRNNLIDHLDQVFQWQVDFSRQIRVGDTYRFAFEREVRPDGSMRAGRLIAAELVNQGTAYHAIWFDPNGDGQGSYFDLEGESVRRASTPTWPVSEPPSTAFAAKSRLVFASADAAFAVTPVIFWPFFSSSVPIASVPSPSNAPRAPSGSGVSGTMKRLSGADCAAVFARSAAFDGSPPELAFAAALTPGSAASDSTGMSSANA